MIAEQPVAVQPTVSSGTSNVEWVLPTSTTVATSNLYTATDLEPRDTLPFVSSNITTVTSTMGRLVQATSKHPNPSFIQSMREPTVTTVQVPSSFVPPTVSCHIGLPPVGQHGSMPGVQSTYVHAAITIFSLS